MNRDSTRLELARQAWQKARPTAAEVLAGVGRVRRALLRSQRPRHGQVPPVMVAFALVFGAALAYAAAAVWWQGAGEPGSEVPIPATSSRTAVAQTGRLRVAASARAAASGNVAASARAATSAHSAASAPPNSAKSGSSDPGALAAPRRGSWRDVDEALAQGRQHAAQEALMELSRRGSQADRGKALLGLAQLAASRGDCTQARKLVSELEALGADGTLARRGRRVVSDCARRAPKPAEPEP